MSRRIVAAAAAALLAAGCGSNPKPTIPDKMLTPPGGDTEGASGGGKKGKPAPRGAPDAQKGEAQGDG